MFDNRTIHVFDWLLNGNFIRRRTPMRRKMVIPTVLLMVVLAGGGVLEFIDGSESKNLAAAPAPPPVPAVAGVVAQHDVPIYLTGVGTVVAYNTVVVRSQIQGQIVSINFTGRAGRARADRPASLPGPDRSV